MKVAEYVAQRKDSSLERIENVDFSSISAFGEWLHGDTGLPIMCAVCGENKATWRHNLKTEAKSVLICFGCHEGGFRACHAEERK